MITRESARPSPAAAAGQEASPGAIARDPDRSFARRIDCSGAETRAPQPSRVGRGLEVRAGARGGRGPGRAGPRHHPG